MKKIELDPHVAKRLSDLFFAIGDQVRMRIVTMLADADELYVGQICDRLKMTQPAISHHLATLRLLGILEVRRAGKFNFYRVSRTIDVAGAAGEISIGPVSVRVSCRSPLTT